MDTEKKREIATELLTLTQQGIQPEFNDAPEAPKAQLSQFQEKQASVFVDLYVEHYSLEQLQAQLDFYTSEMGKSILKTQSELNREFRRILPELTQELSHPEADPEDLQELLNKVKSRRVIKMRKKPPDESDA